MTQKKKSTNTRTSSKGRTGSRSASSRTGSIRAGSGSSSRSSRDSSGQKANAKPSPGPKKAATKKAKAKPEAAAPTRRTRPQRAQPPAQGAPSLAEAPRRKAPAAHAAAPAPTPAHSTKQDPTDRQGPLDKATDDGQAEPPEADTVDEAPQSEPFDDSRFSDLYPSNPLDVDRLGIGSPLFPPGGFGLESGTDEYDDDSSADATSPWADDPSVEMRIREIQERLDGLMASQPHEDLDVVDVPTPSAVAPTTADTAVDAAREVLESEYYRKKWGRTSLRDLTHEVDDFGLDPDYEAKLRPILDFMFKKYFRVEVEGIRNVPSEGRAVVVANHSGALPFDGVMLREAIRQRHSGRDDMRWLAEDFSFYLPFLGVTLNRIGAVRACPENAERLLAKEHLVGVFPEGAEGIKKLYKNRYRLGRFGRGGFVRLCLKTRSPIIPCAIIGAEETNPILYRFDNLSKLLGLDYLPVTPTFPLLGPLGLLPAPTKWKMSFGEPISVAEYGPQAAQDHVLVGRLAERVRTNINDLLETNLRRRKSIWL